MVENKREPTAEEILERWKKIIKDYKFGGLTEEEKLAFERRQHVEEMSRKYPSNFKTCPPGCPQIKKH